MLRQWDCPQCEMENFTTRYQCLRCNAPRPRNGDEAGDRGCNYGSPNSYRGDASECDDESRCESDEKADRCERTRSGDELDSNGDEKEAQSRVLGLMAHSGSSTGDQNTDEYENRVGAGQPWEASPRRQQPPIAEQKCDAMDATEVTGLSRSLAVFGLSPTVSERDLRDVFERCGEITKIYLNVDAKTQISKGSAFIEFVNGEDAAKAKEATAGMKIDHRPIRVTLLTVAEVGEEVPDWVVNEQILIAHFAIELTEKLVTHRKQFKLETVQTRLVFVTKWYLELTEKMRKIEEFKGMFVDGWWSSVEHWCGYLRRRMKKLIDVHPCTVCKVRWL